MRNLQQIRDSIAELHDELEAIVAVATEEKRELSADETKRVDEINDTLLPGLDKDQERQAKIEARIKQNAASRLEEKIDERSNLDDPRAAIRVPAKAHSGRPLEAFEGPDAKRDAYVSGQFILAKFYGREQSIEFCRDQGLIQSNMTSGGDSLKGGHLVPDEMSNAIIRVRDSRGVFPRYARNWPMGSDVMDIPRLINDVTTYFPGEGGEITASDAKVGQAKLVANKMAALTKVSSELDEDAVVDVADLIVTSMGYAFADKIDSIGFNGDGTSTYGGFSGLSSSLHANAIQDAATGNVSAATLDLDDFEATVGLLPEYEGADVRWYMNKTAYWNSARSLQNAAGGNTVASLSEGGEPMLFGYPVVFTQVMSVASGVSTIAAYLGDLSLGCAFGSRRGVRVGVSDDRYFENDLIGIKATQRIAVNIHETGDTVRTRPVVALKTAAS